MSDIFETRKALLGLLSTTDFSNELKKAFKDWLNGNPKSLEKRYPGLEKILHQGPDFQTHLAKYITHLALEEISRSALDVEEATAPIYRAIKNPSIEDRPFDIVNDYNMFLELEKLIRKRKIIDSRREYCYDRKKYNKQCLIGFVCVLYRNGCFKKINPLKPGPNKKVTLYDAMLFCQERYHFGSLDMYKKDKELCFRRALERIPGLKEFDQKNKTKLDF